MTDNSLPKPQPPQANPSALTGDVPRENPVAATSTPPGNIQMPPSAMQKGNSPLSKPVGMPAPPPMPGNMPAPPPMPGNTQASPQIVEKPGLAGQSMPPAGNMPVSPNPTPNPAPNPAANPMSQPAANPTAAPAAPSIAKPPVPNTANKQDVKQEQPKFAKVKKTPLRFLPFVVGGLLLVGAAAFLLSKILGQNNQPVNPNSDPNNAGNAAPVKQTTLTYWGLWEPNTVFDEVLVEFQTQNPGIKINYIKQSHQDYRERLQTAVASGNGPDLFRYHMTWSSMMKEELAPMPQSVMSAAEYKDTFYPSAAQMLNVNGQIVGMPLMYDGLALYYNKAILKAANAEPPTTWAELKTLASRLAVRNGTELERGGLAIGNASNVEHFSDILGLLMLQNGADLANPNSNETRDALTFYTNFAKQDQVWSDKLPSSTVAFAREDVAMMMAPSWRAHEVKSINPDLDFGIAPTPKLGDDKIAWASFWAEGVSSKSPNKEAAWKLLKYLSSREVQQKLYNSQSQQRAFGEIYSRRDLADQLAGDPLVSPFLVDAPDAESWYLASFTHDNGINDLLIKYYEDAINAILDGSTATDVLPTIESGTNQVLRQYGVTK